MTRLADKRPASVLLFFPVAVAVFVAVRAKPETTAKTADEDDRRAMFPAIVANEATYRREVVKDFPADPWSQDDAFHEKEYQRIKSVAAGRGVRLVDGLIALDEGLRAARPGRYRSTVPPCRPRTIY